MATVILGGGIIGLSTAYYLSSATTTSSSNAKSKSEAIHIVDSAPALFASASGFAGGFLAADWFSPDVASLGALSFRLHRELAEKFDGPRRWGYAPSWVYGLQELEGDVGKTWKHGVGQQQGDDWLSEGTSRAGVAPGEEKEGGDKGMALKNADGSPAVFTPQAGYSFETIATPEGCAQIEPRELCVFLLQKCKEQGVEVHLSTKATGVIFDDKTGAIKGLKLYSTAAEGVQEGVRELECKNIVLAAGAWTPGVFETLFPQSKFRVPIEPLAGHSLVVKSPRYKIPFVNPAGPDTGLGGSQWLCYSIYCNSTAHWSYSPEAFARLARNGETEVWIGGLNDSTLPLPELATDVKAIIDPESIKDLRRTTVQIIGEYAAGNGDDGNNRDDLETIREALCFRPVSQRGTPFIGKVPESRLGLVMKSNEGGVWIASGHGPWGITLSLGTGRVISEMLMGEKTSADVEALRVR